MTLPQDAPLKAALESQCAELDLALARLEAARAAAPQPSVFWRGTAREAYNSALGTVLGLVDGSCTALRLARERTSFAIAELSARG